ncbi:MAG: hypothetical protein PUB60_04860 [Veillonellaceae bacterium]|nr:hypothetical protein [Veillonellaceae bacterium]
MLSFYELRKEENFRDRLKESWRKLSEAQRVKLEEMIVRTAELNEVTQALMKSVPGVPKGEGAA